MDLDWVVNEDTYGPDGVIGLPPSTIAAAPLTYPRRMVEQLLWGPGAARDGAAFPEGEKQFVKAVVGFIQVTPPTFAVGNVLRLYFRITKKPMDTQTAGAITDGAYTIGQAGAYSFANERFAWQRGLIGVDNDILQVPVKATVNQWLEPDEALFIFYENNSSGLTGTITMTPFLRTLMKAES